MSNRNLVAGRWVASWTNITSSITNGVTSFGFSTTLGLFVFHADGTVTGEFRLKDGTDFNVRPISGTFALSWDSANQVHSGTATVTVTATGNVNTMTFVRVNADELCFILEKGTKADGTVVTRMVHGTLHRVVRTWWWWPWIG